MYRFLLTGLLPFAQVGFFLSLAWFSPDMLKLISNKHDLPTELHALFWAS